MKPILDKGQIFIENIEEFRSIESSLHSLQYISFICRQCGKETSRRKWRMKENQYKLLCRNCICENNYKDESFKQNIITKIKQTCLEKYGVPHNFQIPGVKEHCSQTWKNKSEEEKQATISKHKQTCLEKYGVEFASQSPLVLEKIKQTNLERYGVEYTFQSQIQKEKTKQTLLKKYGVTNPTYIHDHVEKVRNTCMEKYGVENSSQSPVVREKYKQTMLQKYGKLCTSLKRFVYENQYFDSSWELAVWIWANDLGKNIKREPVSFEYEFESQVHLYYPDFEIDDQLIEVKGSHFLKEGKMINPFDHNLDTLFEAKHQCGLQHGVVIWTEKELKPILKYIKEKYGKSYLKSFRRV